MRTVSEYATAVRDTDALDNAKIRSVLTDAEHAALVAQVKAHLLPKFRSVPIESQSDWDSEKSREDHMWCFVSSLDTLRCCYDHEPAALATIDAESSRVADWINEDDGAPNTPSRRKLGKL
ncbi:hypothetical protein [Xanthomonas euvesicatoria]|uniref:hypothetical protein n=1 Tax=Xanthomonas euvesicatoria TaxID=456327 RepID=UPI001C47FF6D|nr:hypothetical protein [Xanthomonas euvesicatoria]MBV6829944.1 hypothetical protein [Xanthomonas campestris pv. viegasii]